MAASEPSVDAEALMRHEALIFAAWNEGRAGEPVVTFSDVLEGLREVAVAVAAATESVRAQALVARDDLARQATAVGGLADTVALLVEAIDAAESTKVVALETEALSIDGALEAALAFQASRDSSTVLLLADAALLAARLRALPRSPVEPAHLAFIPGPLPADPTIASPLGRISAPRGVRASNVSLKLITPRAVVGSTVELALLLAASHPSSEVEDVAVTLSALVQQTSVCAELQPRDTGMLGADEVLRRLTTTVVADLSSRSVRIRVDIPDASSIHGTADSDHSALQRWAVAFRVLRIAGEDVSGPLVPVSARLLTLTRLADYRVSSGFHSPAITPDGVTYVPDPPGKIRAYGPDGERLPDVPVPQLAANEHYLAVAHDESNDALILGSGDGACQLLSVDRTSGELRWASSGEDRQK